MGYNVTISMPQTPRRSPVSPARGPKRPVQDVATVKRQAAQFPSIGTTLKNYQYDPRDQRKRSPGQRTVVKQSRLRQFKDGITLKRIVLVFAVFVLLIGGWVGFKFAWNAHKLFGGNLLGVLSSSKLKGEDDGRVNILLAGNSADDAGHNGGRLTDSIMVISIDTKHNKAFMLSIPRDLWVYVPGDSHQKINGAYVSGEDNDFDEDNYPKGGMGQLEQVVSDALDIPINYYALVNYTAMKQAVDAVGGVDITVKSDDPRGLYDPNTDWTTHGPLVKLSNGPHHLNGQQALDLARARGDAYNSYGYAGSDFTRTENQRKLLTALKTKAVSAGVLANPAKLSNLSDAVGNNVKTDFKLGEVRRLYDILKNINGGAIQSLSLNDADGVNLLSSYTSPQGQSALAPEAGVDDFSDIQSFIRRKTSSNPVVQEAAKIVVLNGTETNGLAGKIKSQLKGKQMNVTDVGDAGNITQSTTTIINLSGTKKPATSAALIKIFGNHLTTQNPYGSQYNADFIVIVGQDQAAKNTSSQ
jgi:LCP family protein required for cell wall assembly